MVFNQKLEEICQQKNSLVCVGLDPDLAKLPVGLDVLTFCQQIIIATTPFVAAFKPNLAFFEALGEEGFRILKEVVKAVPTGILTIADAKRADIGNTASAYARAIFDELGFDAVTLSPYMGHDSIEPFIRYQDKGSFILCRTSNSGAVDFQQLKVESGKPLYQEVAAKASSWNKYQNIGLVIGATAPSELKEMRLLHPDLPFLIPGVGAQGGEVELTVKNAVNRKGMGFLINSSRQIIYASSQDDYAYAAAQAARELKERINSSRGK